MYGLALQGGGAKGAYQIGALKAILEYDLDIGAVVGTSIGSFNAAVFAQGDFEKLYKLWYNGSSNMIMDIDDIQIKKVINKNIDMEGLKYWTKFVKDNIKNKGIEVSKVKKLYDTYVDEEKLRNSKKVFGMVTYDLTDKKPLQIYLEDMKEGKVSEYILASSYLPVFKREKIINEKNYMDGGVYDNCPLSLLTKKNFYNIIEVKTGSRFKPRKVDRTNLNVITIEPSKDTGSILFADNNLIRENIKMGYYDAIRVFEGYLGKKYYIISQKEEQVFQSILNMSNEQIIEIVGENVNKELLNKDPKKMLLENIIPTICQSLKNDDTNNYQKSVISMIESVLSEKIAPMYKIYTLKELLERVKPKLNGLIKTQEKSMIKNIAKEYILRFLKELKLED